jgi:hypothetical protein
MQASVWCEHYEGFCSRHRETDISTDRRTHTVVLATTNRRRLAHITHCMPAFCISPCAHAKDAPPLASCLSFLPPQSLSPSFAFPLIHFSPHPLTRPNRTSISSTSPTSSTHPRLPTTFQNAGRPISHPLPRPHLPRLPRLHPLHPRGPSLLRQTPT